MKIDINNPLQFHASGNCAAFVIHDGLRQIAIVELGPYEDSEESGEACRFDAAAAEKYARLMAAAPRMLAALEQAAGTISALLASDGSTIRAKARRQLDALDTEIRAAIETATQGSATAEEGV